jgi:hypothetical protein
MKGINQQIESSSFFFFGIISTFVSYSKICQAFIISDGALGGTSLLYACDARYNALLSLFCIPVQDVGL